MSQLPACIAFKNGIFSFFFFNFFFPFSFFRILDNFFLGVKKVTKFVGNLGKKVP